TGGKSVGHGQLAVAGDVNRLRASSRSRGGTVTQRSDRVGAGNCEIQRFEFLASSRTTEAEVANRCAIKVDIQAVGSTRNQAALELNGVIAAAHVALGGNGSQFLDVGE